jgi:anti-anti-sigma factor
MRPVDELPALDPVTHSNEPLNEIQESCCVLPLRGPLQPSLDGEIACKVRALLDRGECFIVLDLTHTSRIDAAGVGELVRAYNMAIAAHAALQVVHPTTRVRQVLERVGLLDILRRR